MVVEVDSTGQTNSVNSQVRPSTTCFITPWNKEGYSFVLENSKYLNDVSPAWYRLARDGNRYIIEGDQDKDMAWLRRFQLYRQPLEDGSQPQIVPRLVIPASAEMQTAIVEQTDELVDLIATFFGEAFELSSGQRYRYDGVTLELPYLWAMAGAYPLSVGPRPARQPTDAFTGLQYDFTKATAHPRHVQNQFIKYVSVRMRSKGQIVHIVVPPHKDISTSPSTMEDANALPASLRAGYTSAFGVGDMVYLSRYIEKVYLMTYDYRPTHAYDAYNLLDTQFACMYTGTCLKNITSFPLYPLPSDYERKTSTGVWSWGNTPLPWAVANIQRITGTLATGHVDCTDDDVKCIRIKTTTKQRHPVTDVEYDHELELTIPPLEHFQMGYIDLDEAGYMLPGTTEEKSHKLVTRLGMSSLHKKIQLGIPFYGHKQEIPVVPYLESPGAIPKPRQQSAERTFVKMSDMQTEKLAKGYVMWPSVEMIWLNATSLVPTDQKHVEFREEFDRHKFDRKFTVITGQTKETLQLRKEVAKAQGVGIAIWECGQGADEYQTLQHDEEL